MADYNHTEKDSRTVIIFTVAECGEYYSLGEYYEGIGTLEEAAAIYRKFQPERMNGIPSIGIKIHVKGTDDGCARTAVQEIIRELAVMFPDKEVVDV